MYPLGIASPHLESPLKLGTIISATEPNAVAALL